MTYQKAKELLATAKSRIDGKFIADNTRIFDGGDHLAIRFHHTDIIKLYPNGDIVLNTGGWKTATTKRRLNTYLPNGFRVYQDKHIWYLCCGDTIVEFEDGIKIDMCGSMIKPSEIGEVLNIK